MRSHCVLQKSRQTWLPFEFAVFLCCARNLTCILRVLHLQMSSWTCMSKMRSCVAKDSWKMVDVSQVMIEILAFMSMKLELLSLLLSDSPFLSSKSFFVFPIFDVRSEREFETHILPCFLRVKYSKEIQKRQLPLLYYFYCISSENQNRDTPSRVHTPTIMNIYTHHFGKAGKKKTIGRRLS
jgi:hypothetical protein